MASYNYIDSEDGSLIIPSTVEISGTAYTVTSIRSGVLSGCEKLTSVEIPSTVTTIEGNFTAGCINLTKITVSDQNPAFCSINGVLFSKDQTSLIIFPAGKGSEYTVPSSVTGIGSLAFAGCAKLLSVKIPESVTSIGSFAFSGCSVLTSVEIPGSVSSIGDGAFSGCVFLTSVEIPNGITSISDYTFANCVSMTSVSIPESVLSIGYNAFSGCIGLASVKIPNSVTTIGTGAFTNCSGLASVEIPNSVTSIGDVAFFNCTNMTSVSIPGSVTAMGYGAFSLCPAITSVYYNCENPLEGDAGLFTVPEGTGPYDNAVLYVPAAAIEKCRQIDPWKNFKNIQEYGFSGIDDIAVDIDSNYPCEIYNLNGVKTGNDINALAPGIYILRQGSKVRKIAVK